jgi:hypothetical protein
VNRTIENQSFSLFYIQAAGQTSGLGSTSDTRRGGVEMTRTLGDAGLALNVSAFDTRGVLDNSLDTRGISASATIGVPLGDTLGFLGGGQFQKSTGAAAFAFTQARLFVSLNYSNPDLWRFIH